MEDGTISVREPYWSRGGQNENAHLFSKVGYAPVTIKVLSLLNTITHITFVTIKTVISLSLTLKIYVHNIS